MHRGEGAARATRCSRHDTCRAENARRGPWVPRSGLRLSLRSRLVLCVWASLVPHCLRLAWSSAGCATAASAGHRPFPFYHFSAFAFLISLPPRVWEVLGEGRRISLPLQGRGAAGTGRREQARPTASSHRHGRAGPRLFPCIAPVLFAPLVSTGSDSSCTGLFAFTAGPYLCSSCSF